jgi:hypothetical protein
MNMFEGVDVMDKKGDEIGWLRFGGWSIHCGI